jgi:hypothetical protein
MSVKEESDLVALEQSFSAEGWGNGSLHPMVVRNIDTYWKRGPVDESDEDFYVGFGFHETDWVALFFDVLKCPKREMLDGEDIMAYEKRERERFQQCTAEFPMLGRMFTMFRDANYYPGEVGQLREQCLKLQSETSHEAGRRALAKLILACGKALESEMGLILVSD